MKKLITTALGILVVMGMASVAAADDMKTSAQDEAKFLVSMSEHHEDGIEMAKLATEKAQSKEVKDLAKKISKEQSDELKKMESWKSAWYPKTDVSPETQKMDMSKLEQSRGTEFDKAFLDMMTEHHKQAMEMTKNAMPDLKHKETKSMATKSLKTQAAEVAKMEKLKSSLQ